MFWKQTPGHLELVPFVSKATGIALAKAAALISIGQSIADLRKSGLLPAKGDGVPIWNLCQRSCFALESLSPSRWNRCRLRFRTRDAFLPVK